MEYRNECVDVLSNNFGIICDAHHHEVATAGQCEIDIRYDTLVNCADSGTKLQIHCEKCSQET